MKQQGSRRGLMRVIRILQQQCDEAHALLLAAAIGAGGTLLIAQESLDAIGDNSKLDVVRVADGIRVALHAKTALAGVVD